MLDTDRYRDIGPVADADDKLNVCVCQTVYVTELPSILHAVFLRRV